MRVFVTGGTGFIGKYVVRELLNRKHEVLVLSRSIPGSSDLTAGYIRGDLSYMSGWSKEVAAFLPEAAIHMAWEGLPDYSSDISAKNAEMGEGLLSFLSGIKCGKILCAGSCWEYGAYYGALSEGMEEKAINDFARAKRRIREFGQKLAEDKGFNFFWARVFYAYGPGQKKGSLIPCMIDRLIKGEEPAIKTPLVKNDFIFAKDAASAMCDILEKGEQPGIYNVGSGYSTRVSEIADIIASEFGMALGRPGMGHDTTDHDYWADITRIKNKTGWEPRYGIGEGIRETIAGWA
ncbi:MAG: NAD(P)-dependent oxidoreductase [Candidatus Omnitrophica bacterium]|nr:NAD(P)-dependent oxidoreductase [Candidatus Omnitrophota bacterium]